MHSIVFILRLPNLFTEHEYVLILSYLHFLQEEMPGNGSKHNKNEFCNKYEQSRVY